MIFCVVRVTEAERALLAARAGEIGLSAYVRRQLFGTSPRSRAPRRPTAASRDAAQLLAQLGSSEALTSLRDLAHAARIGVLPVTPETEALITQACEAVLSMRADLVAALGLRSEA